MKHQITLPIVDILEVTAESLRKRRLTRVALFGTKFTIAFVSGVRWYPARRVTVTGDLRALFWRLKYPVAFHTPLAPDGSRVVPLTDRLTDWTTHPWISLGIGWTF